MTTGPEDQMAAAGRGRLRASHADREHVIGTLKAAFVQGRLTKDELDARVGQTFASRTYAELAALTADIPAGLAGAQSRRPARVQSRPSMIKVVTWCTCVIIAAELLLILMLATVLPNTLGWAVAVFANLVGLPLAGGQMLDTWRENRSRGQLPPRRAQRGQPLKGEQDGSPGGFSHHYSSDVLRPSSYAPSSRWGT